MLSQYAQILWQSRDCFGALRRHACAYSCRCIRGRLAAKCSHQYEDLCINTLTFLQGVSLDTLLQRIIQCKVEMRKAMLSGYMQALDESEGLQPTISRLADRMGMGEHPYLPICLPA